MTKPETGPVTLEVQLQRQHGLIAARPPGGARLEDGVCEDLTEQVASVPRAAAVRLRVYLAPDGSPTGDVADLIRHHFARLRERAEYRLRRVVHEGRVSLVIGALILLLGLTLSEAVGRLFSGGVSTVIQEGLTIVGWVALWRPLDLLLFERWVVRRDIALYRRMERMEITVR